MALSQDREYRNVWMFPRNKRRIVALDIAIMLRALWLTSDNGTGWEQGGQDDYANHLESLGVKRGRTKKIDPKSGGPRTYRSQFQCLGLISVDKDGKIIPTQAGLDISDMVGAADALRWQVLKMQYPSEYSVSRMVNINPEIQIRPAHFLIRLAEDPEINGLSDSDIVIPVVCGKTDKSFDECKEKILRARNDGLESVLSGSDSLYTSRTKKRSFKERVKDIKNVANTFANVLIGSGLCERKQVLGTARIFLRPMYQELFSESTRLDLVKFQPENIIQSSLQIGLRKGAVKDTRAILSPPKAYSLDTRQETILRSFVKDVEWPVSQEMISFFTKRMVQELGVSHEMVLKSLLPALTNQAQYINHYLIELANGGTKTATDFEKAIERVFNSEFGFETKHTGQARRPAGEVGGYADILLIEGVNGSSGIIDAKAYKKYSLDHSDVAKMLNTYIPATSELYEERSLDLKFVGYVSHLFGQGALNRANEISRKSGLPVVLCSIYGLNNLRENADYQKKPQKLVDLFTSKAVVTIGL